MYARHICTLVSKFQVLLNDPVRTENMYARHINTYTHTVWLAPTYIHTYIHNTVWQAPTALLHPGKKTPGTQKQKHT